MREGVGNPRGQCEAALLTIAARYNFEVSADGLLFELLRV